MILVTVGAEKFPFNRLMNWLQVLLQAGFLSEEQEELVIQYGTCTLLPPGAKGYSFLPDRKFQELIEQARLIISHCGEGTLYVLENTTLPYILVPRSQRFSEHVDDHQVELAVALAQSGVPIAWSPGDLVRFLASPYRVTPSTIAETSVEAVWRQLKVPLAKSSGNPVSTRRCIDDREKR